MTSYWYTSSNPIRASLLFVALLSLVGCAVSTDTGVVATPPIQTGKATTATGEEVALPTSVAMLPFANRTDSEFAFTVVRRTMFNHFASKNYRMLHWQDVDNRLRLAGIEDPAAVAAKPPAELMDLLGVDGLIYGNITHYNKTFAGIYAQVAVGVEMRFVNRAGSTVWEGSDVQTSRAGGISTTPVGLLMNALVAAKHIYGDIELYRTADELGRALVKTMPEPAALTQREKPRIAQVVHSGVGQYLKYGDTLEIGIEGDAGLTAAARIEGLGLVDLEEVEPGQYVGKVALDKSLQLEDVAVAGVLQDAFGQSSSWISPYGLLNVDNEPPPAVSELAGESRDGAVQLTWRGPSVADVAGYRVALRSTERGGADATFDTESAELLVTDLDNFRDVYLGVTAVDRAGNASEEAVIPAVAAPDPRYGRAADLPAVLPPSISGVSRLTRSGSPYYLRTNSRVTTDGVLLVAPGVEIVVSPRARLTVLGELQMHGDASAPIRVSDDNDQGFEGFLLLQSTLPVQVQGLNVAGGGIPIEILAGQPLISNSVIANSDFNALSIAGTSRPVIRNCEISGAKAAGVIVAGGAQPTFVDNRFVDNEPFHIQNGSNYQIDASRNEWEPAASPMTILGDVTY